MARIGIEWRLSRTLLVATFVTAALYLAQDVFIPLALAALLSFLFTPLITRLERRGLKRTPAVLIVAVVSILGCGCLGLVVINQLVDLAENMPSYKENVEKKLNAVNGRTGTVLRKAIDSLSEFGQPPAIERPADSKSAPHDPNSPPAAAAP